MTATALRWATKTTLRNCVTKQVCSTYRLLPKQSHGYLQNSYKIRSLCSSSSSSTKLDIDSDNYYSLLKVPRNASQAEIKRAYYRLAKDHHPDRSGGDPALFSKINHAYETLSDPRKRNVYDRYGVEGVRAASAGQAPPTDTDSATLDDILREFGDLFGGAGVRRARRGSPDAPIPGDDQRATATISLQEAAFGVTHTIRTYSRDLCNECSGTGKTKNTSVSECPQCRGSGHVQHAGGMFQSIISTCHRCNGVGSIMENPCSSCDGDGIVPAMKEVSVTFPPGCDTGMMLRIPGGGASGIRHGPAGDLFVQVEVEQDDYFHRQGRDLHVIAPISMAQASLGGKTLVKTIDGTESVIVKSGTQPDDVTSLPGRGLRGVNSPKRGNQIVHFKVVIPEKVTERQEELLRELMGLEGGEISKPEECSSQGLWQRFRRFLKGAATASR